MIKYFFRPGQLRLEIEVQAEITANYNVQVRAYLISLLNKKRKLRNKKSNTLFSKW